MTFALQCSRRIRLRGSLLCIRNVDPTYYQNRNDHPIRSFTKSTTWAKFPHHNGFTSPNLRHAGVSSRRLSSVVQDEHEEVSNWNVANAVTIGRIVAAPFTGYCIMNGNYGLALGTLVYAGISDWADGFLARRFKLQTVLGSYLDPAADKLLITSTTICLAAQDVIPQWLVALIVARDVALVGGWAVLRARRRNISAIKQGLEPLLISKVNTSLQITLSFTGVLCAGDWGVINPETMHNIGLATAATTAASGISYGNKYLGSGLWRNV